MGTPLRERDDLPEELAHVLMRPRSRWSTWTSDEATLVAAYVGFTPTAPYPGKMIEPWNGLCSNEPPHDCSPSLRALLSGNGICRRCAWDRQRGRSPNNKTHEERAVATMTAAGAVPLEPYPGANRPWRCRCLTCNAEVTPRLANVRNKSTGPCKPCSMRTFSAQGNEAQERRSRQKYEVHAQTLGHTILTAEKRPSATRDRQDTWLVLQCSSGHQPWDVIVGNYLHKAIGCPTCANQRCEPGINDLATKFPDMAAQANGWDPTTVVAGSGDTRTWRCVDCGHVWNAKISTRTTGRRISFRKMGCPECSEPGFKVRKNAEFYVVLGEVEGHAAAQFGISNDANRRLREHALSGFTDPVLRLGPVSGRLALDLETRVKRLRLDAQVRTLADLGFKLKSGGHTEAFFLDTATAREFLKVVLRESQGWLNAMDGRRRSQLATESEDGNRA